MEASSAGRVIKLLGGYSKISAGLRKKCEGFTFVLAGFLVQRRGFKNFSGSLKSCQKVGRVRSENSAGPGVLQLFLTCLNLKSLQL